MSTPGWFRPLRSRIGTWIALGALLCAVLCGAIVALRYVYEPRKTPQVWIPADEDIVEIRAALYNEGNVGFPNIPEFEMPPSYIPKVLRWFRPPTFFEGKPEINDVPLGHLMIRLRSGETEKLTFYFFGNNPLVFSTDGMEFFWGRGIKTDAGFDGANSAVTVGFLIRRAYKEIGGEESIPGQPVTPQPH